MDRAAGMVVAACVGWVGRIYRSAVQRTSHESMKWSMNRMTSMMLKYGNGTGSLSIFTILPQLRRG